MMQGLSQADQAIHICNKTQIFVITIICYKKTPTMDPIHSKLNEFTWFHIHFSADVPRSRNSRKPLHESYYEEVKSNPSFYILFI